MNEFFLTKKFFPVGSERLHAHLGVGKEQRAFTILSQFYKTMSILRVKRQSVSGLLSEWHECR